MVVVERRFLGFRWEVGSCEDKALLVSLDTFRCPNLALTLSMVSVVSATKAIVFPVRISTKICLCVRCRCRLFGSPEDVVVLETHVLCAYSVSLLSDLYSPFPFLRPVALPLPLLSLSLSLLCARVRSPAAAALLDSSLRVR